MTILLLLRLSGGIGLFLLGLVLLTDGLKAWAGESLRRVLLRFTGTPGRAFLSGFVITALVQSSSATTVALIGFVSAGLIAFPQAVGVVFGTSVGTTVTGWLVAGLGLRVSVGAYTLPLIAVGALMRLLARGRMRSFGLAIAGFALVFLGIETMREGMKGLGNLQALTAVSPMEWRGRLMAILMGFLLTILLQSSSAAAATFLTALDAGSITFEQGALLVIGAAVGTTVKGALVTIGAETAAKRTAAAHIVFYLAAGGMGLLLLPFVRRFLEWRAAAGGPEAGPLALAAFHTLFIAVSALIFLPFADRFSRWMARWLPERGSPLTAFLDPSVLSVPAVAIEASRRALLETACAIMAYYREVLMGAAKAEAEPEVRLAEPLGALNRIRDFVSRIAPEHESEIQTRLRAAVFHALDHTTRLAAHRDPPAALGMPGAARTILSPLQGEADRLLETAVLGLRERASPGWLERLETDSASFAERLKAARSTLLLQTAAGEWPPEEALAVLEVLRWLDRIAYHAWRISHYLAGTGESEKGKGELSDAKGLSS